MYCLQRFEKVCLNLAGKMDGSTVAHSARFGSAQFSCALVARQETNLRCQARWDQLR